MIPVNILSRLALRSRSDAFRLTRTILTSALQQKHGHVTGQCSAAGKLQSKQGQGGEKQKLAEKKEEYISDCKTSTKNRDGCMKVVKTENLKSPTDSEECSCPSYATPKCEEEKNSKSTTEEKCEEEKNSKSTTDVKCEEEKVSANLCQDDRNCSSDEDDCKTQKKTACQPLKFTMDKEECQEERDNSETSKSAHKWDKYCGPTLSSGERRQVDDACSECEVGGTKNVDPCKAKKPPSCDVCLDAPKPLDVAARGGDPCASQDKCVKPINCDEKSNPFKQDCQKSASIDPVCETSNICHEPKENTCDDEDGEWQKEERCKALAATEFPKCCRLESAQECINELKELQRQWEAVVAAHGRLQRHDVDAEEPCTPPAGPAKAPVRRQRSTGVHVVLCAVLAAATYYAVNGDFQPERLFLEDEARDDDDI